MRRLLPPLALIALLLIGCSAPGIRTAKQNANQVKDGMTVAQASVLLGGPPNHAGPDFAEWRSNDGDTFDGTPRGSVRFEIKDGVISGVPPSGIISPASAQKHFATLNGEKNRRLAKDAADFAETQKQQAEARERSAQLAQSARAAAEIAAADRAASEVAKLRDQLLAEAAAARTSSYTCMDKANCTKAFALAQIYVSENADQKIQVATDTIVETYNPTEQGKLALKVIKTPSRGTTEVISIVPSCKEGEFTALLCSLRRTTAYTGLRGFIRSKLSQ